MGERLWKIGAGIGVVGAGSLNGPFAVCAVVSAVVSIEMVKYLWVHRWE